jgi:hypothetical protein
VNMNASDVLARINEWTMEEHGLELEGESIIHMLNHSDLEAPQPLIEAVELLLTAKEDGKVRIDPEELEGLEDEIKKYSKKYI